MLIGVFLCQNLAYALPEATLRPHLLFDSPHQDKDTTLFLNNVKRSAFRLLKHELSTDLTAVMGNLGLLKLIARSKLNDLIDETLEAWEVYSDDKDKMIVKPDKIGVDIKTLFLRKFDEAKELTESFIYKYKEELKITKPKNEDEYLSYIKEIEEKIKSLFNSINSFPGLDTNNINEIITFYVEVKRVDSDKLKLCLSKEDLIFDRVIKEEPWAIAAMVGNFISNAEDKEMTITTAKEGNEWIEMEFSDAGPGIKRRILSKIFDKGFTTKGSKKRGYGLSSTLEYLKLIGGRIEVKTKTKRGKPWKLTFDDELENSEISKSDRIETGTTFTVLLPLSSKSGTPVYTLRYFARDYPSPHIFLDKILLAFEDAEKKGYRFFIEDFLSFIDEASGGSLEGALECILQNIFQYNNFRNRHLPIYGRIFYEDGHLVIQAIGGGESEIHEDVNGRPFLVSGGVPEQIISNSGEKFRGNGLMLTFENLNALKGNLISPEQEIYIRWFHDKAEDFPEYADHPYEPVVTEVRLPLMKIKTDPVSPGALRKIHYEYTRSPEGTITAVTLDNIWDSTETIHLQRWIQSNSNEFLFSNTRSSLRYELLEDRLKITNFHLAKEWRSPQKQGILLSISQWLLQEAMRLYPDNPHPLEIRIVDSPQFLGVADWLFEPGSIEIIALSIDDDWHNLIDFDVYGSLGPLKIFINGDEGIGIPYYNEKEISIKKDEGAYKVVYTPEGVEVAFDGFRITIKDKASGVKLDWVTFTRRCGLRGRPRRIETSPIDKVKNLPTSTDL